MIRGGLRSRLVVDSVRLAVVAGLTDLGWFDATVNDTPPGLRTHRPLRYATRPQSWDDPIAPNALVVTAEDIKDDDHGFGGDVEDLLRIYIDIYGQDDRFGWQLAVDVRDILEGRRPDIGRDGPIIDVYDLRQATPSAFTHLDVEQVTVDKYVGGTREWEHHWFMVRADVEDDYTDEMSTQHTFSDWNADLGPVWQQIQAIEVP